MKTAGIPRVMHIVWVSPHDPPDCRLSWLEKHTGHAGWSGRLWVERAGWKLQALMDRLRATEREPEWGVMEIARLEVLASEGGFAPTADSECVRGLDAPQSGGGGPPQNDFTTMAAAVCAETTRGVPGTSFLGGVAGAEAFMRCLDELAKIDLKSKNLRQQVAAVFPRVAATMKPPALKVLPLRMFSPVDARGVPAAGAQPIYGRAMFAETKGMNHLRSRGCQCLACVTQPAMWAR